MSALTDRESMREKNADDEPTSPLLKSSSEISCSRDKLSLSEYFIATKIPAKMAIITSMSVKINFPLFSFSVREQENLRPFMNECDLYDFNIYNNINFCDKKEHFNRNRFLCCRMSVLFDFSRWRVVKCLVEVKK